MKKRWLRRILLAVSLVPVLVLGYWFAEFAATFDLFGYPVRNNQYGWLGPTPHGTRCVSDIGKVHYWECSDISLFEQHQFGCHVWLHVFGYVGA